MSRRCGNEIDMQFDSGVHAHTQHTHTADLAAVMMEVGESVPAKLLQVPACLRMDLKPPACMELIPIRLDSAPLSQR